MVSEGKPTAQKLIGIGSVEEVPLSPPSTEPNQRRVIGIGPSEAPFAPFNGRLLPGEIAPTKERPKTNKAKQINSSAATEGKEKLDISSPKITVQLPNDDGEKEEAKSEERGEKQTGKKTEQVVDKVETEFNVDNDGGNGAREKVDEESRLEPLIPSEGPYSKRLQRLNMTHIELGNSEQQGEDESKDGEENEVPKLKKLISQLKKGNLSELDLEELQKQLAQNEEPGEPRENTEPTTTTRHSEEDETGTGKGGETELQGKSKGSKHIRMPNPKREKASNRNLEAFRKGSEREADDTETEEDGGGGKAQNGEGDRVELVDGQRDPILRKIVDFQHPPVILSLERPHPTSSQTITPLLFGSNERSERRRSNRIDGRGGTEANANDHLQRRSQEATPSRALGVRSEKVDYGEENGTEGAEQTEEVKMTRKKSSGRMGTGGETTTTEHTQTQTKKFNLRRPQKRRPLASTTEKTTTEADQSWQYNDQQLLVVDSMVENAETEQQQFSSSASPSFSAGAVVAGPWPSLPQHSQQFWPGQSQHYNSQQQINAKHQFSPQRPQEQQNLLQYPQQHLLQYPQQQSQSPYAPHQYQQQPNQQQQYQQQPEQLQYPQQQNLQQYHRELLYPVNQQQQQHDQLQYKAELNQHQKSNLNPSHTNTPNSFNSLQNLHQLNRPYQQPEKEFGVQNRQLPQQNGAIPFHGRQFGQRQRAVEQPIDQQKRARQNNQWANGRKEKVRPKGAPPTFAPKRMPSPAKGVNKSQQTQAKGKAPRKFPPRTIGPPSSVLSHQTTTPSAEIQYPFSSGTLLTLAQPAQNQRQKKQIIARK